MPARWARACGLAIVMGMAMTGLSSCDRAARDSGQRIQQGLDAVAAGNYGEAYWAWRPLADRGVAEAQYQLGWLYANGNGLRVDLARGIAWWRKAAARGHLDAEFAIGMAYLNGHGRTFAPDRPLALKWLSRAGGHGSPDAREILLVLLRTDAAAVIGEAPDLLAQPWLGERMPPLRAQAACHAAPSADSQRIGVFMQGERPRRIDESSAWVRVASPDHSALCWLSADNFADDQAGRDGEG